MKKTYLRFYLLTLGILLALSAYPLIMGLRLVFLQWQNGSIRPGDYARYVIPYTAICLSILITAALHPFLSRLKKASVLTSTALAIGLFVLIELLMESIVINNPSIKSAVSWQLFSCVYTPKAVMAFNGVYDDSYKIHYFLVSFIMIALIVNVVCGYGKKVSGCPVNKVSLNLQTAVAVLYVGLCVFANLTGFFRRPADVQPPISGLLTGLYFIVMGASAGVYLGSMLIEKGRLLAVWLPAALAVAVCGLMYMGEYLMLHDFYRFGSGFFFDGLPGIALAPVDILVVLLSGVVSALAMDAAKKRTAAATGRAAAA